MKSLVCDFTRVSCIICCHRLLFFYLRFCWLWCLRLRLYDGIARRLRAGRCRHAAVNRNLKGHRTVQKSEVALAQRSCLALSPLHIGHILPFADIRQTVHHIPFLEIERVFVPLHIVLTVEQRPAQQRVVTTVPWPMIGPALRCVPQTAGDRTHRGSLVRADIVKIVIAFIAADRTGNTLACAGRALLD